MALCWVVADVVAGDIQKLTGFDLIRNAHELLFLDLSAVFRLRVGDVRLLVVDANDVAKGEASIFSLTVLMEAVAIKVTSRRMERHQQH